MTKDLVIKNVLSELAQFREGWLDRSLTERRNIIHNFENRVEELSSEGGAYDFNAGLVHHFGDRTYGREMNIAGGTLLVGGRYKEPQINILLSGSAFVMTENVVDVMTAPCVFSSDANTNKVGFIIEDMKWITVVSRSNDTVDPEEIMDEHIVGGTGYVIRD